MLLQSHAEGAGSARFCWSTYQQKVIEQRFFRHFLQTSVLVRGTLHKACLVEAGLEDLAEI